MFPQRAGHTAIVMRVVGVINGHVGLRAPARIKPKGVGRTWLLAVTAISRSLAHQCVRPTSSSRFLLAKPARVITVYDRPPSHVIPDIPKASTLMDIDGNYSARLHAATLLCPRPVVGGH